VERIISYPEAIREALSQEMAVDPAIMVLGQNVNEPMNILGTTKDLLREFGPERVFDTPIAEDGMTGVAIGLALSGLRPVLVHIRMDFVILSLNQLINMAAKMRYMYGGVLSVPLVVRSIIGKSWGQGAQHSQSIYPLLMNIPGLKIIVPTTPFDAKGGMIRSIRDNNPVLFIEHRHLYYQKGYVPDDRYTIDFGKARVFRDGSDITLVGISQMAIECLRAAKYLEGIGIKAEVIDPVTLYPLDMETIGKSVARTGRLIVVDNSWMTCGASAEIIASLSEKGKLKNANVSRMGFAFTPCPTTPALESHFYPDAKKIAVRAYQMLYPQRQAWVPDTDIAIEEVEFRGPF
jgi:pyruvate/2-oxoglutarate/acetoin dehydrogenase E1 component